MLGKHEMPPRSIGKLSTVIVERDAASVETNLRNLTCSLVARLMLVVSTGFAQVVRFRGRAPRLKTRKLPARDVLQPVLHVQVEHESVQFLPPVWQLLTDYLLPQRLKHYYATFTLDGRLERVKARSPRLKGIQSLVSLSVLLRGYADSCLHSVIFSCWTKMLDLVQQALQNLGFCCQRIDGKTSIENRKKALDQFHGDPTCTIMLASIASAGEG